MAGILVTTDAGGRAEVKGIGISANAPMVTATGSLSASGDMVVLAVDGYTTLAFQLGATSWTGTVGLFGSMDGGVTYPISLGAVPYAGGLQASSFTASGNWEASIGGLTHVKLSAISAISNGPAAVVLNAATGHKSIRVGAPASNPLPVLPALGPTIATAPVTVGTSVSLIAAAAAGYVNREYANNGTDIVWIGGASVTQATGYPVAPGQVLNFSRLSGALYGIANSAQAGATIQY